MKIHAYYDDTIPSRSNLADLAELWHESWSAHGWEPVLIGRADIGKTGEALARVLPHLPTVNNRAYEDACYLRWAAMAELGGGWMCDLDVMNYGFAPVNYENRALNIPVVMDKHVPCLVYGNAAAHRSMVARFHYCADRVMKGFSDPFISRINGHPHTSDMLIIESLVVGRHYVSLDLVKEFIEHGWESAPLVHFASGRAGGRDKATLIREQRAP